MALASRASTVRVPVKGSMRSTPGAPIPGRHATARARDRKLGTSTQPLDPLGRPYAGRDCAQRRLGCGEDLLRIEADGVAKLGQSLPAALVVNEIGDVLGQGKFPALPRRHRVSRPACLFQLIQQRRQAGHGRRPAPHTVRPGPSAPVTQPWPTASWRPMCSTSFSSPRMGRTMTVKLTSLPSAFQRSMSTPCT